MKAHLSREQNEYTDLIRWPTYLISSEHIWKYFPHV